VREKWDWEKNEGDMDGKARKGECNELGIM
jgi:hypothetical protein